MVAPATTLPLGSTMLPTRLPVFDWASADKAKRQSISAAKVNFLIVDSLAIGVSFFATLEKCPYTRTPPPTLFMPNNRRLTVEPFGESKPPSVRNFQLGNIYAQFLDGAIDSIFKTYIHES